MAAGAGVVSEPDTVVLDALSGVRFLDLLDLDDLTVGLLDLLQLRQKVPESRLGDDVVWRKDGHAVQRWVGDLAGGQMTTHNSVLTKLQMESNVRNQNSRGGSPRKSSYGQNTTKCVHT